MRTDAVPAYTQGPCVQTHTVYLDTKTTPSGERITNGTNLGNRKWTLPTRASPGNLLMEQVTVGSGSVLCVRGWRMGYTDTAEFYTQDACLM